MLKWVIDRVHGLGYAVESPLGWMPRHEDICWKGLTFAPERFYDLMEVSREAAMEEAQSHEQLFHQFYSRLPKEFIFEREAPQIPALALPRHLGSWCTRHRPSPQ